MMFFSIHMSESVWYHLDMVTPNKVEQSFNTILAGVYPSYLERVVLYLHLATRFGHKPLGTVWVKPPGWFFVEPTPPKG